MKKIALIAGFLALALPVLATGSSHHSSLDISNHSTLTNNVYTVANTGLNFGGSHSLSLSLGGGGRHHGGSITTGDAFAQAEVDNIVNSNTVNGCGCFKKVKIENNSHLTNNVYTIANTGVNFGGRGSISSGDAGAGALVMNVVNTNVVGE